MLKDWIESSLLGPGNAFLSSDQGALPPGAKWLDTISAELASAKIVIVLCSARSIARSWINFETGCAWSRGIPVIPLCHSGFLKGSLPRPISDFQAIDLTSADACRSAMDAVSKHCALPHKPQLDYALMWSEVVAALPKVPAAHGEGVSLKSSLAEPEDDMPSDQLKVLESLQTFDQDVPVEYVAQKLAISVQIALAHLELLEDRRLVGSQFSADGKTWVLNRHGRKKLLDPKLLK